MGLLGNILSGFGSVAKGLTSSIPIVGDVVSAASDVIGKQSDLSNTKDLMNYQQQLNQQNADYNYQIWNKQFDQQNARQDYLNQNQYAIAKQSLKDAGLTSASLTAGTALGSSSTSNPSGGSASGVGLGVNQNNYIDLLRANADIKNNTKIADSQAALNYANADKAKKESSRYDELTDSIIALQDVQKSFVSEQTKQLPRQVQAQIDQVANAFALGVQQNYLTKYGIDTSKDVSNYKTDTQAEVDKFGIQTNSDTQKFLGQLSADVSKYIANKQYDAAMASVQAMMHNAEVAAAAQRYGSNLLYQATMFGNETQRRKVAGDFMTSMAQAGFTTDEAFKMMTYVCTGNYSAFEKNFGKRVSDNAFAMSTVLTALTGANVDVSKSDVYKNLSTVLKNTTGSVKDVSDMFNDWFGPNASKGVFNNKSGSKDKNTWPYTYSW